MQTTIDIPDGLYRRLQARAAAEGCSVNAVILHAVEQVLAAKRVALPLVTSTRPGSLRLDNARIYDVISFP